MEALALEVVTTYAENSGKKQLPTTIGTLGLNEATTGGPLIAMRAGYLTVMWTRAVNSLATEYLARQGAKKAAAFRAGMQAGTGYGR